MAKETNTVTFETLEQNLGVAVNLLLSFVVFVLTLLSTPISQFKGKGIHEGGASKISCVTVWGLKYFCNENPYEYRPADIGCDKVASIFKAAEAFYVLSVICSVVCCATSLLFFFQGWKSRVLVIIPAALQVVLTLIPWACMTAVWYQDYCGGSKVTVSSDFGLADGIPYGTALRDNFKTSAGYGLTIAAWCIQVISVGAVILL